MKKFIQTSGPNSPAIHGNFNKIFVNSVDSDDEIHHIIKYNASALVTFEFEGSDTLMLSQFFLLLEDRGIPESEFSIIVDGRDNITQEIGQIQFINKKCEAIIDGYIRSLVLIDPTNNEAIDIGGNNATKERIAANNVKIILGGSARDEIKDLHFPFYNKDLAVTEDDLTSAVKFDQILQSIAIAKKLHSGTSFEYLLGLLDQNFESQLLEQVVEALRSFEKLCGDNPDLATKGVMALIKFIKNNYETTERALSIVYAIESLGYVGNSKTSVKMHTISFLIKMLNQDSFLNTHKDICWASLVTIERLGSQGVKIDIINGIERSIVDSHKNSDVLINCIEKIKSSYLK